MKLSIIIPAYNEEDYIGDCLDSVLREIKGKSYAIEVVVVNNASTDGTREIVLKFPDVRLVDETEKGLPKARQRGLLEAQGEFLAYIDADTRLHSQWLPTIEKKLYPDKNIACYSGPYKYYDGSAYHRITLEFLWKLSAPLTYWLVGYMVLGGNFVARRDALIAMGGFDTNIKFYGEDTDIARRISKFGKAVFDMKFFIYSSSRRFKQQGLIKISYLYAMNFIWQILFHKPYRNGFD